MTVHELPPQQQRIVQLLRQGFRVTEIALALSLSQHTVRNHLKAVFLKVGVHSQAHLLRALAKEDHVKLRAAVNELRSNLQLRRNPSTTFHKGYNRAIRQVRAQLDGLLA